MATHKTNRRNQVINFARVRWIYLPGKHPCPHFVSPYDAQQTDQSTHCETCHFLLWQHREQWARQQEAWEYNK